MRKVRGAHHRGSYARRARLVRTVAEADPLAVCWRDGLTLGQHHRRRRDDAPPTWTAGHTVDGAVNAPPWLQVRRCPPPGSWLAPEVSTCNYSAGATLGNTGRAPAQRVTPHARRG
jgi:hypothetical protein